MVIASPSPKDNAPPFLVFSKVTSPVTLFFMLGANLSDFIATLIEPLIALPLRLEIFKLLNVFSVLFSVTPLSVAIVNLSVWISPTCSKFAILRFISLSALSPPVDVMLPFFVVKLKTSPSNLPAKSMSPV